MKKVFSIISIFIVCSIIVFMSVLCFVKTNVSITYGSIYNVNVFKKSTVASNSYSSGDEGFDEVLNELQEITNLSIFQKLLNNAFINEKLEVDIGGKFSSFSSDLMQQYVCVEIVFNAEQDVVVYYEGDSKVISYWSLIYVIPETNRYDEILVYYSSTNNSSQRYEYYGNNSPIVLYGITTDFIEYVNSL